MRVLVTGGAGFLGWNLLRDLSSRGHVVTGTYHRSAPDLALDARWAPLSLDAPRVPDDVEAIVHAAAIASVAACDADRALAVRTNVELARELAELAAQRALPFVLISTDLVFDGTRAPYAEDAEVSPASFYGETKARAERVVLEADPSHHVLRVSLVVGSHRGRPGGFLAWTMDALDAQRPLRLYANQVRTPLFAGDVAPCIEALITRRVPGGIHHAAGPERLSRVAIGREVARAFGVSDASIEPVTLVRDDDCSLSCRDLVGIPRTPLSRALAAVKRDVVR